MKKAVLVIDDEAIVRVSCKRVLEPQGYEVALTERGEDALKMLQEKEFDVVITDLLMPDMDGLEVLKRIKQQWAHIPVIIITGYGTASTAAKALELGAFEVIEKPFTPDAILQVVNRALSAKEQ